MQRHESRDGRGVQARVVISAVRVRPGGVVRAVAFASCLVLAACGAPAPASAPAAAAAAAAPSSAFPSIILDTHGAPAGSYGFAVVDATPAQLARLGPDQRALVWLGGYQEASCSFVSNDDEIRAEFATYHPATDPRTAGYYLADEPDTDGRCPAAPEQVRQRAALVRSLDGDTRHFTLVNVDNPALFAAFRDSADVMATDPYPCTTAHGCDWSLIPRYIARLRAAGVARYMGMLQAFSGGQWRWPTGEELQAMIDQWRASDWCGAITFSWSYDGGRLADRPDLLAVLKRFNADLPEPEQRCA